MDQLRSFLYPFILVLQGPPAGAQPYKTSIPEFCERIKEDYNYMQAHHHR